MYAKICTIYTYVFNRLRCYRGGMYHPEDKDCCTDGRQEDILDSRNYFPDILGIHTYHYPVWILKVCEDAEDVNWYFFST